MTRIHFLTSEQEALIPEYQQKWKRIYLSTQPIQQNRAKAAVQGAYAVMGKPEPEVIFCTSPRAALERLQTYVSQVEFPQNNPINNPINNPRTSPEDIWNNFVPNFTRAIWENIKISAKQQNAGTKPLYDLLAEVSSEPFKSLQKHIENCLPKDLSTFDVVEQSFLGISPLFDNLDQNITPEGQPEFSTIAAAVDKQFGWIPGKDLLFKAWLKQLLQSTLVAKVSGFKHPKDRNLILAKLSPSERKFLLENPPIITSNYSILCIWLDYAISVMSFPHNAQKWSALQGLVKYCGWILGVDNLCIICDRPTKILVNEDNQLHGEGEAAIEFSDGFVAYAYNGTYLPEKYGTVHPSQWQTQWILEEQYNDLQQALIQGIGAVRLCQELPLIEEIEQEVMQEYTLFKLENKGVKKTYILKRFDSQTGNIYAVFIPWMEKDIKSAIRYANQNYSAEQFPIPDNE